MVDGPLTRYHRRDKEGCKEEGMPLFADFAMTVIGTLSNEASGKVYWVCPIYWKKYNSSEVVRM